MPSNHLILCHPLSSYCWKTSRASVDGGESETRWKEDCRRTAGWEGWCVCGSVTKSCHTLCDPMDCITPGFLSITISWSLLKLMSIELVMPSNHLILCHPLLLPPSIFPSIRVFISESALHIGWPKYWSLNFSISPSNSGLISFSIDWFDLLAVQGTLQSSPAPQFKGINSSTLSLLYGPTLTPIHDY